MVNKDVSIGELLDETTLTLEELALACAVEPEWILERIDAGILTGTLREETAWCFLSADLVRARRLVSLERDFDANPELAALVADLIEEVNRLKQQLKKQIDLSKEY
jgi:chaperone modulatory protein CbpM